MSEWLLVARLLGQVRAAGTPSGHLALKSGIEHLGVCVGRYRYTGGQPVPRGNGYYQAEQESVGTCTTTCAQWQQLIADAERYLSETVEVETPAAQQGVLWDEAE